MANFYVLLQCEQSHVAAMLLENGRGGGNDSILQVLSPQLALLHTHHAPHGGPGTILSNCVC